MDISDSDNEKDAEQDKEDFKSAKIRHTDFPSSMQIKCIRYAGEAVSRNKLDKDASTYLKQKLDQDDDFAGGGDGAWQVIIGRSFGVSISHETKYLMFFDLLKQRRTVLAFKTQ